MKNLLVLLAMTLATTAFAQSKSLKGSTNFNDVKVENFKIEVEVDSAEDIESSFNVEDFVQILDKAGSNEAITFSMVCNGRKVGDDVKSHVKYELKGNTNDKEKFLVGIEKLRASAIKFYNSKK